MKIAIPLTGGKLSAHFGHCQEFAFVDVDSEAGKILETSTLTPPPHEPGSFPAWVADQGAKLVIAGGMGQRAISLFQSQGLEVVVGSAGGSPEELATAWLKGDLSSGANLCDH
ncbi:MAG: NifB/NifX family molybdenum-iron cluster-binding protein [Gemmatimonadales bacterium]|nr:NifB/NifX family molybdenum-iron cluster-binding protein [Gemmatimonadales bacterium]